MKSSRCVVFLLFLGVCLTSSCNLVKDGESETLFTSLSPEETGVTFSNNLSYSKEVNPFSFHSFYNGGGVAVGDINNDGLQDLFFCGNQVKNKLYLNKGNLQFEDISSKSELSSEGLWYTGATFADVNGDGFVDLYVCRAADFLVGWRGNQLFINNGDLTFTEKATEFGLANTGFSTQSVFFDYDNDGDLDCYLLSNSNRSSTQYNPIRDQRKAYADKGGNKLYRNDDNHFTDVTKEAGIYSSVIGFGLGVTISDINKDGWQDMYISNDFFERDYLYLNNKNGSFTECIEKYVREMSLFSMGADIADINNDGYPDIYVTDMLPEIEERLKAKTSFEIWEKYQSNVQKGYYHQFLRNVLQLNRGPIYSDTTPEPQFHFSEISRFAGVHATDWSWGALISDLDNDGWKDIFVSNGMYKDVTDQDFIQFVASDSVPFKRDDFKKLVDLLESRPISNYAFSNNKDLTFTNKAKEWGLGEPGFSNGSAYADLDNDGDMDLITNNIDAPASIYRNNTNLLKSDHHYLKVVLAGTGKNKFGIGGRVTLFTGGQQQYLEQIPARGFLSTVDARLNFGLGTASEIDSVIIDWPGGERQRLTNVKADQIITINQSNAMRTAHTPSVQKTSGSRLQKSKTDFGITFVHTQDKIADFNTHRLLFHDISSHGPRMAVGDVNGDKRDDLFVTGAQGKPGELYIQGKNTFSKKVIPSFEDDKLFEDTDCVFLDADNDQDLDLFVTSGGNVYPEGSPYLANRLYLNDGKGNFTRSVNAIEAIEMKGNTTSVSAADFDLDNDIDLALGTRSSTGKYGEPGDVFILENDGHARFKNSTTNLAPTLVGIGMVTDIQWVDFDNDKDADLVITGEYMPVVIFRNDQGKFSDQTASAGLLNTNGWWNRINIKDINNDGYPDIIAGNHGMNSRFKGSGSKPVSMYVGDFDKNGTAEQLICTYNGDQQFPFVLRHDLVGVVPSLKKKILKYKDYQGKTIDQLFTKEQLSGIQKLDAFEFETSLFINSGKGTFTKETLPKEAQFAPVYAIHTSDLDSDGTTEIIFGGNLYESKPEAGIYDGSYGLVIERRKDQKYKALLPGESLFIQGAIRDINSIRIGTKEVLLFTLMNGKIQVMEKSGAVLLQ